MSSDLRYPIGRLVKVPAHSSAERAEHIAAIAELPRALNEAVTGLSEEQLDTPYREGGWTLRQVVHHLADSHTNALVRFKWALTENDPMIKAYDERAWAELPDARLPIEVSLRFLDALHERWVGLLLAMPPLAFSRPYQHPETGPHTLDMALGVYAWHGRHHTAHVTELRRRKGW
jgi:uncharacterized damage-inducible protein DinB